MLVHACTGHFLFGFAVVEVYLLFIVNLGQPTVSVLALRLDGKIKVCFVLN